MKIQRLHFQLTPLLDLLLIVIFAQYLDVQQTADQQSESVTAQVAAERAEMDTQLSRKLDELEQRSQTTLVVEGELSQRKAELERQIQKLAEDRAELEARQRTAGNLLAKLFDVPQEVIAEVFRPREPPGVPQTAEEVQRLKDQLERLANDKGREIVEFLLTYDELRKRADIWSVHIRETGEIVLKAGEWSNVIRAKTPDEFASKIFTNYKTLPQPKNLVVVLVSYGDARADARNAVLKGLPMALKEMRDDRLGRTQFEYAILGFDPGDGPTVP
ncbi:hypothetical protein [Stratiformator vulcanicus]|uniref:Uncharacterized protein n=1 Tax=Stratiformator vulcanicus TaxID=2527980 RepID=A0A517R0N4_9PLAN|nr:hypothetical protein [Stratiformator vulcanicus]QDT37462.1 hypothetical protein Pan189_18420 [Stratiformator vulcanicus]